MATITHNGTLKEWADLTPAEKKKAKIAFIGEAPQNKYGKGMMLEVSFPYDRTTVNAVKSINAYKRYIGALQQWHFPNEDEWTRVFDRLVELGFYVQREGY